MSARRSTTWLTTLCIVIVSLGGCGSDQEEPPTDPETPTASPTTGQPAVHTTDLAECEAAPVVVDEALSVTTDEPDEIPYLDDFVACTHSETSGMYLRNNSEIVWTVTMPAGVDWNYVEEDLRAESFHLATSERIVLVPDGQLAAGVTPESVQWTPDFALSASWEAHELVASELEDIGYEFLEAAARRRAGSGGAALVSCTRAAGEFADLKATSYADDNLDELVIDGMGLSTSSAGCVTDLDDISRPGSPTSVADDLRTRVRSDLSAMESLTQRMQYAQRGSRALVLLSRIL